MFYPFVLAAIVSIYGIYNIPGVRGWCGEMLVRFILSTLPGEFIVMNDLYMPAYDGMYTQIDHLVISGGGIIVIETKNYRGKLKGGSRKKYWTAERDGRAAKVYNPIRQNSYHIKMLRENCPNLDGIKIHSLICLVSGSRADINTGVQLAGPLGLRKHIYKLIGRSSKYNSMEIKEIIAEVIIEKNKAAADHRKMLSARAGRLRRGFCPRCNAKLLRKRGIRGEYFICSNYPACRFRVSNRI
jgi:hypothetical protein